MLQNYSETADMIYDTSNVYIMERRGGAVDMHDFNTVSFYVLFELSPLL